jgi:hypothetical protein
MQLFQTIRNTLEIIAKSYFCVAVGSNFIKSYRIYQYFCFVENIKKWTTQFPANLPCKAIKQQAPLNLMGGV